MYIHGSGVEKTNLELAGGTLQMVASATPRMGPYIYIYLSLSLYTAKNRDEPQTARNPAWNLDSIFAEAGGCTHTHTHL